MGLNPSVEEFDGGYYETEYRSPPLRTMNFGTGEAHAVAYYAGSARGKPGKVPPSFQVRLSVVNYPKTALWDKIRHLEHRRDGMLWIQCDNEESPPHMQIFTGAYNCQQKIMDSVHLMNPTERQFWHNLYPDVLCQIFQSFIELHWVRPVMYEFRIDKYIAKQLLGLSAVYAPKCTRTIVELLKTLERFSAPEPDAKCQAYIDHVKANPTYMLSKKWIVSNMGVYSDNKYNLEQEAHKAKRDGVIPLRWLAFLKSKSQPTTYGNHMDKLEAPFALVDGRRDRLQLEIELAARRVAEANRKIKAGQQAQGRAKRLQTKRKQNPWA